MGNQRRLHIRREGRGPLPAASFWHLTGTPAYSAPTAGTCPRRASVNGDVAIHALCQLHLVLRELRGLMEAMVDVCSLHVHEQLALSIVTLGVSDPEPPRRMLLLSAGHAATGPQRPQPLFLQTTPSWGVRACASERE